MKILISIFLFFVSTSMAGITFMQVEPNAKGDLIVTTIGLLPEGKVKIFTITETSDKKKFSDVENSSFYDFNRKAIRCLFYFSKDGSIVNVDFHMETPFESVNKPVGSFPSGLKTQILTLKTHLESL